MTPQAKIPRRPAKRSAAAIRRELEALRRESRELIARMEEYVRLLQRPGGEIARGNKPRTTKNK